jgi:hypothetical protein
VLLTAWMCHGISTDLSMGMWQRCSSMCIVSDVYFAKRIEQSRWQCAVPARTGP